jgi:G3E family GTPase
VCSCRFGITSFVYTRRRPFHPLRLREIVLRWMPVSRNKETGATEAPENNQSPVRSVMRSKGFMWLSHGHPTAFYWSHAGMHFEIRCVHSLQSMHLEIRCVHSLQSMHFEIRCVHSLQSMHFEIRCVHSPEGCRVVDLRYPRIQWIQLGQLNGEIARNP